MDMKYVIWLVTGGIVALLLSIGVVIPIVESSAYTTVSNGETEGMTYDLYDTPVSKTILFTPDVSNMTYNAKIWTQPGDVMTEMNGTLNSMYLFASDYLMVYLDASLNIRILKADPGNSLASLVPTGYPLDSTTISIANYDVTVTVGSRNIACNGAIDTFAYIPTVDGAYGSYNHGGINLIGNEINVGGVVVGDVALYFNGSRTFGTYGVATSTANVDIVGNRLNSISWAIPSASVEPIEEITRNSIVTLGNEGSTVIVPQDPNDTSGILSNMWNVTLYDDNTCRVNFCSTFRTDEYFMSPSLRYNGSDYEIKVWGNGTDAVVSSGTFTSFNLQNAQIVNDNAFKNSGITYISSNDKVKVVGDSAFEGCSVDMSYSSQYMVWIGDKAFKGSSMSGIYLDKINHIGASAFEGCSSLSTFGYYNGLEGVYLIGDKAFKDCTSMYDSGLFGYIDMQKIANIGSSAFEGCSSFAYDYIMFAPYLTSVGDKAFKGVGSATSVTNYSSATFGSDVFADSTVTVFNNLGGSEITQNNVGSGITINNGYSASTFFGMISGKIPKDGIVYELILLIPMFVIVGMVLAIAVECMISRRV